jgi:hypothetical protein
MNIYFRNIFLAIFICSIIGFGYFSYYDQKIDQNVKMGVTAFAKAEQQRAVIKEGVTYVTIGGSVIVLLVTLIFTALFTNKKISGNNSHE